MFFFSNPNKDLFDKLYADIDGYTISHEARDRIGEDASKHIIYGELNFKSLQKIYKSKRVSIKLNESKTFYDLGSGCGKIVVASDILLPNFEKFVGIEVLEEMHEASELVKERLSEIDEEKAKKIEFINDDFFNVNLSDADVIFLHFPMKNAEELYLELEEKLRKELKYGCAVISAIREFADDEHFAMFDKMRVKCSYGKTSIFCYYKI